VFEAATRFRDFRLPELFCGHPRSDAENEPVRYPVACSPQAWAAGSLPHALWNLLGLHADALAGVLHVVRPRLPRGITELTLGGVTVGDARVDLRFRRRDAAGSAGVDSRVTSGAVAVRVTDEVPDPSVFEMPAVAGRAA
jgi:hypothetical protein